MLELFLVQGILLKKAVSPLLQISTRATVTCTEDGISLETKPELAFGMVMAVLRISSSGFDFFSCDSNCFGCTESIDLSFLNSTLPNNPNDGAAFHLLDSGFGDSILVFDSINSVIHCNPVTQITRTEEYNEPLTAGIFINYLNFNESKYEYKVIVGIPSEEFRRILRDFRGFFVVNVSVTDGELKFSSSLEDHVLTKENGCIIWGVEEYAQFKMTLYYMDSFLEASEHSALVWMFQSPDSPAMLNCPVGPLGNIKYYFA